MRNGSEPVLRAVDRWVKALSTETAAVLDIFARVASCSVKAPRDMPPSDISALDGFVVSGPGNTFLRAGTQEMGRCPMRLKKGQAVFVPTGAPLPKNGRFVMSEHVREQGETIWTRITGEERREWGKGSWLKKGTFVVKKGQTITAVMMENLSLAGITKLDIYRQARVAVMTTGDEIHSGVVPDSNRHLLAGLIRGDGGYVHHVPTSPDRVEEMAHAIRGALPSDLLIITGGTAKGKKDITREALKEAGAMFLVDKPRILPGKTMAFGLLGEMPFFLLPGNPKSIRALYELFVRRCLMRLQGVRESKAKEIE
jgi:molybdopterin molybdotransferase